MAEDEDFDNPRDVELSSLSAIYPEIQQVDSEDPYTVALDIPVNPSKAVTVFFPATADDGLPPGTNGAPNGHVAGALGQEGGIDSHELAHLPSVHLEITFGPQYPAEQPPQVSISTNPPWVPADTIKRLEDDAARLWEEMGRDMVGFTYIDHVQQAADSVFELVDGMGSLEVHPSHKIAILDYDIKARRAAFERETFDCGVCLEPKKGTVCHRMLDCGHVFCVQCLQDFYNNAIKEGDITAVKCLTPNCAKERAMAVASSSRKRKKPKTFINPSELLQIPLDQETVKRYVTLKYKIELEADKNTIYCPRQWCNGAARSKKHRKPQGLELAEAPDESISDEEDEDEDEDEDDDHPDGEGKSKPYKPADDLLAICEECSFAFCSRCYQSWHGEFFRCIPRRDKEELTADELASLEYMRMHTTPCPTCGVPAQKTHGCNHMICNRCQSHFCYLCSSWLDPGNPYQHFNEAPDGRVTGCYMRLWELEQGDGDDVGIGFAGGAGGRADRAPPAPMPVQELIPEIEEPEEDEEEVRAARQAAEARNQDAHANGGQVGIAREGPLVLRIAANQPAAPGRGGPRGRQPAAPAPQPQAPLALGVARGAAARAARIHQPAARGGGPQQQVARGLGGGGAAHRGQRPGQVGAAAGQQRGRGRGGGGGARAAHRQNNNHPANQGDGELDAAQQAWVRQFVMLALNDEEDILF